MEPKGSRRWTGGAGLRDLNASACPISWVEPAAEQQFWSRADLERRLHGVSTADVTSRRSSRRRTDAPSLRS